MRSPDRRGVDVWVHAQTQKRFFFVAIETLRLSTEVPDWWVCVIRQEQQIS